MSYPDTYWVLGTDSDVGKTTFAAALIRVLNRSGCPAVGFKPFGAFLLQNAIDYGPPQLERSGCEIGGHDAELLAQASPLTPPSMIDVVGPVYLLSYPMFRGWATMRAGSRSLGNVRYLLHPKFAEAAQRQDVKAALEQIGFPVGTMPQGPFSFRDAPTYPETARAFAALLALKPRAVVCEGAKQYLPHWSDTVVNHILLVTGERVVLVPGINLRLPYSPQVLSIADIEHRFGAHRRLTSPMTLAPSAERERVADGIVTELLQQAGLLESLAIAAP